MLAGSPQRQLVSQLFVQKWCLGSLGYWSWPKPLAPWTKNIWWMLVVSKYVLAIHTILKTSWLQSFLKHVTNDPHVMLIQFCTTGTVQVKYWLNCQISIHNSAISIYCWLLLYVWIWMDVFSLTSCKTCSLLTILLDRDADCSSIASSAASSWIELSSSSSATITIAIIYHTKKKWLAHLNIGRDLSIHTWRLPKVALNTFEKRS